MVHHQLARLLVLAALLVVATLSISASAEEWGNLTGKFVFDGTPPAAKAIPIPAMHAACCKVNLNDELLIVGRDGGVANVLVWVRTAKVPIHPEYDALAKDEVMFDNKSCRFEPRILPVRLSQTLVVHNSDGCSHNTNCSVPAEPGFNNILGTGGKFTYQFQRQQLLPRPVECNIHTWMKGFIFPRENPYTAVSTADGSFALKNLPAQELEFQVWQEKSGFVALPEWKSGRFKMTIRPGDNDLGTIKLPAGIFNK